MKRDTDTHLDEWASLVGEQVPADARGQSDDRTAVFAAADRAERESDEPRPT